MDKSENNFAILVCFNNKETYEQLVGSLGENIEIHSVSNENNTYTIPEAYNILVERTNATHLVFIHQDVIVPNGWLKILEDQITILEQTDRHWGVAGVMGVKENGLFAGHIIDPHTNTKLGKLPCRVATLDEVCLIIRKESGLKFDEQLGGYHFYGADICVQARTRGLCCYAIDAPLRHLSGGTVDETFWKMAKKFSEKWKMTKTAGDTIETTCGVFKLNNSLYASVKYIYKIFRRKILRRIQKRTIA